MPQFPDDGTSQDPLGRHRVLVCDFGSHRLRTLRREGMRLVARSQRACYCVIPDEDATEQHLADQAITYARCEEGFVVVGNAAETVGEVLGHPQIPALPGGNVAERDGMSRQVLALIVEAVVPTSTADNECLTSCSSSDPRTRDFFTGLLRLRGYRVSDMEASLAGGVIALKDNRMTGVAVDMGASHCDIAILANGCILSSNRVAFGGETLDDAFFSPDEHVVTDGDGSRYRDQRAARQLRERSTTSDIALPTPLLRPYRAIADAVCAAILDTFEAALPRHPFQRPTPIALIGGLAKDSHLRQQLTNRVRRRDTAAYFDHDFIIVDDEFATCRGLLLSAEIEASVRSAKAA